MNLRDCLTCGAKQKNKWCKPCREKGLHFRTKDCQSCGTAFRPKSKYYKADSKRREHNRYRNARRQLSKIRGKRKQLEWRQENPWRYKIATRLTCARYRKRKGPPRPRQPGSVEKALSQVRSKRRWYELDPWKKKVTNKLSNMKKRRRRRNVRTAKKRSQRDHTEIGGQQIQMCFDWMAVKH